MEKRHLSPACLWRWHPARADPYPRGPLSSGQGAAILSQFYASPHHLALCVAPRLPTLSLWKRHAAFSPAGGPAPRTAVHSLCLSHLQGFGWKFGLSRLIPVSSDDILQRLPNLLPFYDYSKRPHVRECHQTGRSVPSPCQLKLSVVIYRETLWLRVFTSHRTSCFSHYGNEIIKYFPVPLILN